MWDEEFGVDGEIEGEGEKGQNYQVDKTDGDGWSHDSWSKGAEIELGKADGGTEGLRNLLEVLSWNSSVFHDHARPPLAEFGCDLSVECVKLGKNVILVCVLVSRLNIDQLTCSKGIVGSICLIDGLLEHDGCVWHDDDCCKGFEVEHSLAYCQRVVIEI